MDQNDVITKPASSELRPGMSIRHRDATPQTIKTRKPTDDGWWLTDGSGIADHAFDKYDDWQLAP